MALFSFQPAASACQIDDFYLTKEGYVAASTPENLSEAIKYQEEGSQGKIAGMMKNGMVVKLQENIKVQTLERSFGQKMIKIKFMDNGTPYWVKEGSLKRTNCN
jgi:phage gp36-like protein